jgi:bacterial/archaeal transporter family-2 protein
MMVLAGGLLPAQFAVNSALAGELHSRTLMGTVSYFVGAAFLYVILKVQRIGVSWPALRLAPRWAWLGGVIGSAYVVGSVILTQHLGAAIATTLVIAAQIVTAISLDHFGVLGLPKRRINKTRLLAVLLVLLALGLRLWGSK